MTTALDPPSYRSALLLSAILPAFLVAGCGDASGVGRTLPVSGKATLDDAPLTFKSTIILFKPDTSKGNNSAFEPTGTVDSEGKYTLKTQGKKGAPPGWYRVVVTAREEAPPEHAKNPRHRPTSKSLIPAKYGDENKSPLSIEVVEDPQPGAYDLKLTQ